MSKKKATNRMKYKKNTIMEKPEQLIDIVNRSKQLFIKEQTIYNDDTQSITVEIHFIPK